MSIFKSTLFLQGFYQISLSQKSPLPENKCVPGWYIRDVDISDMRIMYEGLENFGEWGTSVLFTELLARILKSGEGGKNSPRLSS